MDSPTRDQLTHSLRECLLLTPFSGIENLPEALPSPDAKQILDGWLALWHPALIAQTHSAPRMHAVDMLPQDLSGVLALLPAAAARVITGDSHPGSSSSSGENLLRSKFADAQGWLLNADQDWKSLQQSCLNQLPGNGQAPFVSQPTIVLFAALGYAYLQIQLLTRQLHYTSNLDQLLFDSQLTEAAQAALAGDIALAERMAQSCFDQLGQERDHYYSLDVNLIDVTLLASSTLGKSVTKQIAKDHPTTFVACARLLEQMQTKHPDSFDSLHRALLDRRASLAGGLDLERPHPLMNFESLKRDLERGKAAYERLGIAPPTVFTRFSFGQMSDMPLHLRRSGFVASMLIAWQGGQYPSGSHAKFSWEAAEGTFLNAVAPPLVDAQDAATYLALGRRIAEALDHQHVPIFMLAHWPDGYSPYFELVEEVVRRTPALGRWQTIDDFFEKTDQPYHQEHLPTRKFIYDWLSDTSNRNSSNSNSSNSNSSRNSCDALIQATTAYHRLSSRLRGLQNLICLSYQLERYHSKKPSPASSPAEQSSPEGQTNKSEPTSNADSSTSSVIDPANNPTALPLRELHPDLASATERVDALLDDFALPTVGISANHESLAQLANELHTELDRLQNEIVARFAKALGHRPAETSASTPTQRLSAKQRLILNSTSAPLRFMLESDTSLAPVESATGLYATGASRDNRRLSMLDLPAFGMMSVPMSAAPAAKRKQPTLVQSDGLLLNDFLEVQIDPKSGAIRSLHVPGKRGNRLSLQLARRDKISGKSANYSQMRADKVETLENSTVRGAVRVVGQLVQDNSIVAVYELLYELLRGDRTLRVSVRLDRMQTLSGSPWNSAYVLRIAWPNESSIITCRNCSSRYAWTSGRSLATEWIEIDDVDHRTTILPQGLAFHSRVEERFMETILSSGGQAGGSFQLGIAVDLPNPTLAAQGLAQPPLELAIEPPAKATGAVTPSWLMHVDAKQVVMQLEAPLVDRSGACVGLRLHISELAGKSVTAKIRALREIGEAHRVDYVGGRVAKLTVEGDTATIALRPSEMSFVDLIWK